MMVYTIKSSKKDYDKKFILIENGRFPKLVFLHKASLFLEKNTAEYHFKNQELKPKNFTIVKVKIEETTDEA